MQKRGLVDEIEIYKRDEKETQCVLKGNPLAYKTEMVHHVLNSKETAKNTEKPKKKKNKRREIDFGY